MKLRYIIKTLYKLVHSQPDSVRGGAQSFTLQNLHPYKTRAITELMGKLNTESCQGYITITPNSLYRWKGKVIF